MIVSLHARLIFISQSRRIHRPMCPGAKSWMASCATARQSPLGTKLVNGLVQSIGHAARIARVLTPQYAELFRVVAPTGRSKPWEVALSSGRRANSRVPKAMTQVTTHMAIACPGAHSASQGRRWATTRTSPEMYGGHRCVPLISTAWVFPQVRPRGPWGTARCRRTSPCIKGPGRRAFAARASDRFARWRGDQVEAHPKFAPSIPVRGGWWAGWRWWAELRRLRSRNRAPGMAFNFATLRGADVRPSRSFWRPAPTANTSPKEKDLKGFIIK